MCYFWNNNLINFHVKSNYINVNFLIFMLKIRKYDKIEFLLYFLSCLLKKKKLENIRDKEINGFY